MKVSAAAVLLSVSSASAFNVGYLNQLSAAPAAPAPVAPAPVTPVATGGPASYLDNLGGTPELVQAIETAPEPAAPEPVSDAPKTSSGYLSAIDGAAAPALAGAGITGYLDALPSSQTRMAGAGIHSHADTLGGGSALTGPGITSHLDSLAPAAPAPVAPAAPAPAAAAPAEPVAVAAAPAAGDYLSTISNASELSGAGLAGYLDILGSGDAGLAGSGLAGYLDVLAVNAAQTSGAGLTGYLDALKTNSLATGISADPSVGSFLESIFNQIMALPEEERIVNGDSVAFAKAEGPYAMSFVKN